MDARGRFFPIKLAISRFLKCLLNFKSSEFCENFGCFSCHNQATAIAANLIATPVAVILSRWHFDSTNGAVAAVLAIELIFDKVFVGIVVFLRPDTLSDSNLDVWSQIVRHVGLLLPAVMTVMDLKDALDLSESFYDTWQSAGRATPRKGSGKTRNAKRTVSDFEPPSSS